MGGDREFHMTLVSMWNTLTLYHWGLVVVRGCGGVKEVEEEGIGEGEQEGIAMGELDCPDIFTLGLASGIVWWWRGLDVVVS